MTTLTTYNFSNIMNQDIAAELLQKLKVLCRKIKPFHDLDNLLDTIDTEPFINLTLAVDEYIATTRLITLFNTLFVEQRVQLVRGQYEPEYFPIEGNAFARIEFAHGFFASALHEISHWCIAGSQRRLLRDFGYWYAPDGRNEEEQRAFERVEIKPQAIECLLTIACSRPFQVSQDNIFAKFNTDNNDFEKAVYYQAENYINNPSSLPKDARTLLNALLTINLNKRICLEMSSIAYI